MTMPSRPTADDDRDGGGVMHGDDAVVGDLAARAASWMTRRMAGAPLGAHGDAEALRAALRSTIDERGLGIDEAWERFVDIVVPNTLGLDSERFLAFVPMSPTTAAVWMDAMVGTANFSAESWLEAAGAVAAEERALDWIREMLGLPVGSGGAFVSGGSNGNLSALAVARDTMRARRPDRPVVAVADTAHASIATALRLLDMPSVVIDTGPTGRLDRAAVAACFAAHHDVGVLVASAGSTNGGVVDDLEACADLAAANAAWLHVDGAYGLAAILLEERRHLFAGVQRADSVIVDPHKWLFAPAGSCALLYREPSLARAVLRQRGPYLDVLHDGPDDLYDPSELGFQLTRRASGLPLWFSLAVHGVGAYRNAVRRGVELAGRLAAAIDASGVASTVVPPDLSVVVFRRAGWGAPEWRAWAQRTLASGVAFVAPTTWRGEPVGRVVFLHPRTPDVIVEQLVATLVCASADGHTPPDVSAGP